MNTLHAITVSLVALAAIQIGKGQVVGSPGSQNVPVNLGGLAGQAASLAGQTAGQVAGQTGQGVASGRLGLTGILGALTGAAQAAGSNSLGQASGSPGPASILNPAAMAAAVNRYRAFVRNMLLNPLIQRLGLNGLLQGPMGRISGALDNGITSLGGAVTNLSSLLPRGKRDVLGM
ncbi:hypothetical protein HDE_12832 [Halotydeus destructor]|nr:hypothetical protein HDE_12832 [Halotydeus destructor]